jgi:hypothetical protein
MVMNHGGKPKGFWRGSEQFVVQDLQADEISRHPESHSCDRRGTCAAGHQSSHFSSLREMHL